MSRIFDFKTHWNASSVELQNLGNLFVDALIASGEYTEEQAIRMVSDFQNESFEHGVSEEAFNNCGEDA